MLLYQVCIRKGGCGRAGAKYEVGWKAVVSFRHLFTPGS